MKADKVCVTANPRGQGPYDNVALARKKIKCDDIKPLCQPVQSQGQQKECTSAKTPVRKSRTEAYIEAMHKEAENLRRYVVDMRHYTDNLGSLLYKCHQYADFCAALPPDSDSLLSQEDDSDVMTGGDDSSDDGHDPYVLAIDIPPQSLHVEPFTQPSLFPALAENPDATYVLLLDGVQSSHYNPSLDWSRHLPPDVPLDRPCHDRALDLLFKFFTSWCLRIVPELFLRDMYRALCIPPSQTPPKTPHYSPMLHNALLALALAFLDEPFSDLKTRMCYAVLAKSYIEDECQKSSLSFVHALSLLASFQCSLGDQTLGHMYFGMSVRMGQALGIYLEFSKWVKLGLMDEAELLDRHWANWTNFTQARDVCWSLYVGRDFCVAEPSTKASLMPHVEPELDKMEWFYAPAKIAPQPNNSTKIFEATCRLLMIARRIMDVVNRPNKSRGRQLAFDDLISGIDVQLNEWKCSLAEELDITPRSRHIATPHKLMLHLAFWWLFILLHRPFFHRKFGLIDHVKLCRKAAESIMDLLSIWRNLYKLRYCPVTLIQIAFSAGTVYILIAIQASSGSRIAQKELRHSLDQETLVQQYLQEIGLSWNCATKISGTLRGFMNEQVRPLLELLDRKRIPNIAGLHTSGDVGDDEEENGSSRSRSTSRDRSSITKMILQISQPHTISSGSGLFSLSISPTHILTSTSSTQVPPPTNPSISPTITISSACDTSSTYAAPSAPTAIQSLRSTSFSNPSSFTDSWTPQPSPDSSPNFNYLPSFAPPDFRNYAQPSSNYMDDPFSGNGKGSSDNVGYPFEGRGSFLARYNFQALSGPSSEHHYINGYLAMLGDRPLSESPFVEIFSEEEVADDPNFLQAPFGTGFPNHRSSSYLGEQAPSSSHGENDNMDLDSVPWRQFFTS